MEKVIDYRSDTLTVPEEGLLKQIYMADVGDDVYGEDHETAKLQEMVSKMLGKEESLFVPTGTMANLIALMIYSSNGGEVIMDKNSHPIHYESGGISRVAGLTPCFAEDSDGIMDPVSIISLIRQDIYYQPKTVLIWLENTHNRGGGTVYPIKRLSEIRDISKKYSLPIHIDGARILNACVFLNKEPSDIARYCDSLSLCFSKGLSSPLGSMLTGSAEFIKKARIFRKMLGGGMRQIGYISYIALFYLKRYKQLLRDDHQKAGMIYNALKNMGTPDPLWGGTNIVLARFRSINARESFENALKSHGILVSSLSPESVRIVTSRSQDLRDIEKTVRIIGDLHL